MGFPGSSSEEQMAEDLRRKGWRVTAPPPPPPVRKCATCGATEEENDLLPLVPIRVIANPGQEGHSDVTRWFCDEHLAEVTPALIALGFESHHHGSTTFLSNENGPPCGGYGVCTLWNEEDDWQEEY